MTAMPADKVTRPEELSIACPERIAEVLEYLTDEGARDLAEQMFTALARAKAAGDLRPVNEVLESHYRTLLFLQSPEFEERWDQAQSADGEAVAIDEARNRLNR